MDLLKLITPKLRTDFMDNYDYNTNFIGNTLFPSEKTDDLEFALETLVTNGNVPAIAKVHAFDTEARIGSREDITIKNFEKILIKEKLPTSEKAQYLIRANADEDKLTRFIFNDFDIENQRVLTRAELMNMQLMSTGGLTINENNATFVVDYGYDNTHNVSFSSWSNPAHDIIGDLATLTATAKADGNIIGYALTSSKVVSYLINNTAIKSLLANLMLLPTEKNVLNVIYEQFGIQFAVNDDVYKVEGGQSTVHRFFPENKISFFTKVEGFGKGLYAPTPDELMDVPSAKEVDLRANVYIKAWKEQDPSTVWTMASAVYLPIIADINSLYIATVTA